ncbi:hypothetical protein ASPTUDRAFT_136797, partial [Aspergillus tubingensis CBS 134.48]
VTSPGPLWQLSISRRTSENGACRWLSYVAWFRNAKNGPYASRNPGPIQVTRKYPLPFPIQYIFYNVSIDDSMRDPSNDTDNIGDIGLGKRPVPNVARSECC